MKLALDENGNYVSPEFANQQTHYLCPSCLKPVKLRHGKKRKAHFAHVNRKNALNESLQHQQAKIWLKEKLIQAGHDPKLEWVFPNGRTSDLFVQFENNQALAIEYQKSPIAPELLKERMHSYQKEKVNQWWIQGEHARLPHRRAEFNSQFYRYDLHYGLYHWVYDTVEQQLLFQYQLKVNPSNQVEIIGSTKKFKLEEGLPTRHKIDLAHDMIHLSHLNQRQNKQMAVKNKHYFCRYFRKSKRFIDRQFAEYLYLKGKVIEDVPLKCFKPPLYHPLSSYPIIYWRYYEFTKDLQMKQVLRHFKWYQTPFISNRPKIFFNEIQLYF